MAPLLTRHLLSLWVDVIYGFPFIENRIWGKVAGHCLICSQCADARFSKISGGNWIWSWLCFLAFFMKIWCFKNQIKTTTYWSEKKWLIFIEIQYHVVSGSKSYCNWQQPEVIPMPTLYNDSNEATPDGRPRQVECMRLWNSKPNQTQVWKYPPFFSNFHETLV